MTKAEGESGFLGTIAARLLLSSVEAGAPFSLVEHLMPARALAAPMHMHSREDEYSYVLEGQIGALLGDAVLIGHSGDLICKPRHQWHTFWNAGDTEARVLEIISPGGFEKFFLELIERGGATRVPQEEFVAICDRYGLQMDMASFPSLLERFSLL